MAKRKSFKKYSKNQTEAQRNKAREKRAALKRISADIKSLQEIGEFPVYNTLNKAIVHWYQTEANDMSLEFKTFKQWKDEGFKVIKGSKGFVVWGKQKQKVEKTEEQTQDSSEDKKEETEDLGFFPISHIFSSDQVEAIEK